MQLRIISATGQVVEVTNYYLIDTFSGQIDVSQLPAGMYQVQFISSNGVLTTKKIVVQ